MDQLPQTCANEDISPLHSLLETAKTTIKAKHDLELPDLLASHDPATLHTLETLLGMPNGATFRELEEYSLDEATKAIWLEILGTLHSISLQIDLSTYLPLTSHLNIIFI